MHAPTSALARAALPRITIEFCTQCKWMLRAAYFAQELLSTFSLSIGEVALQPSTGGTFIITLYTLAPSTSTTSSPTTSQSTTSQPHTTSQSHSSQTSQAPESPESSPTSQAPQDVPSTLASIIWDRKKDGGFPETKELKRRVRDAIDPLRDLGHVDRLHTSGSGARGPGAEGPTTQHGESPTQQQPLPQRPARDDADQACRDCA